MANISGYLQTIKTANSGESVRDAIIKCMKDINEDSAVRATNLSITKDDNVTYTAPKGYAFKNVTVNIDSEGETDPSNTYTYEEFSVTENTPNGEYPDPEEHRENFAYSKVIVNIDWEAITGSIDREGTMNRLETDSNGRKYWDCNWDGHNAVQRVYVGEGVDVNLPDYPGGGGQGNVDGPFMVTFKDGVGKTIMSKSGITKGSYIFEEFPSLKTELESKIAKNLNGKPYSGQWRNADKPITANTTCTPIYNVAASVIGGDDWETIMEDGGAQYAIGEEVVITLDEPVTVPDIPVPAYAAQMFSEVPGNQVATFKSKTILPSQFSFHFMLVAHGEGGTASTWLCTDELSNIIPTLYGTAGDIVYRIDGIPGYNTRSIWTSDTGTDDASGCINHRFLGLVLPYLLPEAIKSHIVACPIKGQYGYGSGAYRATDIRANPDNFCNLTMRNPGKFWLPSYAELGSLSADARADQRTGDLIGWNDKFFTLDTTPGTIDYHMNGWLPRSWRNADPSVTFKLQTRSTCVAAGPRQTLDTHSIALIYHPVQGSLYDSIRLGIANIGEGAGEGWYPGFCTS